DVLPALRIYAGSPTLCVVEGGLCHRRGDDARFRAWDTSGPTFAVGAIELRYRLVSATLPPACCSRRYRSPRQEYSIWPRSNQQSPRHRVVPGGCCPDDGPTRANGLRDEASRGYEDCWLRLYPEPFYRPARHPR